MFPRPLGAALAASLALTLSSCLDYNEEMTIHNDLSGEAYVTLTLPSAVVSKYEGLEAALDRAKIEKRLATAVGVQLLGYEKIEGREPVIKMAFKFSSLDNLNDAIAANPPAGIWAGQFTVSREGGLTKVDRKLGVGDPMKELPEINSVRYKTHFDGEIESTNSPQYNSPAKDVRYQYKLADMLSIQPTQSTAFVRGLPWKLILLSLAIVGGVAWYGYQYFGRRQPVRSPLAGTPPRVPGAGPSAPSPRPASPQPRRPGPPRQQ